jgi:two-component system sensor histidine kinase SenX3
VGTDSESTEQIDFATILASTVHDMKNSLGLLLNTLDEAVGDCEPGRCPAYERFSKLQYEAKRVNNDLIQLLALYKIGNSTYAANISDYSVADFFEEIMVQNRVLLDSRNISVETDCPDDLYWYFDRDLVAGILNNVLNNAFKYARERLRVSAREEDGFMLLAVEDDGRGYPDFMLSSDARPRQQISFSTGSTGLGLYFAALAARLHRDGERQGSISVDNGGALGGGVFTVRLP